MKNYIEPLFLIIIMIAGHTRFGAEYSFLLIQLITSYYLLRWAAKSIIKRL